MNESNSRFSQYANSLAALITVNAKLKLVGRSVLFPVVLVLLSLMPVILWRLVFAWLARNAAVESIWIDAYDVYAIFCSTLFMQFYVPLLAIFLGMSILSEEIENETVVFLLLRPVPRTILVLGKFLSYLLVSSVLLGISLLFTYLIIGSIPEAGFIFSNLDVLLQDWLVFTLGLGAYGAVLMFVAVLIKQRLLAGIFLLFVWDPMAAFFPGSAYQLTVRHYLYSIFSHTDADQTQASLGDALMKFLSNHAPASGLMSVVVLLLLIALCIAMTTFIVKNRNLRLGQAQEA
ncbi:ABC transporter permease [bacterium]|nr:ABC transporter permease [bacterium]